MVKEPGSYERAEQWTEVLEQSDGKRAMELMEGMFFYRAPSFRSFWSPWASCYLAILYGPYYMSHIIWAIYLLYRTK